MWTTICSSLSSLPDSRPRRTSDQRASAATGSRGPFPISDVRSDYPATKPSNHQTSSRLPATAVVDLSRIRTYTGIGRGGAAPVADLLLSCEDALCDHIVAVWLFWVLFWPPVSFWLPSVSTPVSRPRRCALSTPTIPWVISSRVGDRTEQSRAVWPGAQPLYLNSAARTRTPCWWKLATSLICATSWG